jgi:NAD dependent epimerase/dehydratase family.
MQTRKIAIFGSTSHIAKGLINNFLTTDKYSLHLYTRSSDTVQRFLLSIGKSSFNFCRIHEGYTDFMKSQYDVIINCVGTGTEKKLHGDYTQYFTITEQYDNFAINYLREKNPEALYISFSSGAVYGRNFSSPVDDNTANTIYVNHISAQDYYAIARLNAESKHRAFNKLRIIDLRIFSYFSRFIDLTDGYFITDVIDSIIKKKTLLTDSQNIIRDYLNPYDLFNVVKTFIDIEKINGAFDISSARPVEKREILDYFSVEYGLKYEFRELLPSVSPTGSKYVYYSKNNLINQIGFKPKFCSMDTIKQESKYLLKC